jgi:hypothetical protein
MVLVQYEYSIILLSPITYHTTACTVLSKNWDRKPVVNPSAQSDNSKPEQVRQCMVL